MISKSLAQGARNTESGSSIWDVMKSLAEELKESVEEQLEEQIAPQTLLDTISIDSSLSPQNTANNVMARNLAGGRNYNSKYIDAKLADFQTLRQIKNASIQDAWTGYDDYNGAPPSIRQLKDRQKLYEEQAKSGEEIKADVERRLEEAQAPKDSQGDPIELVTTSGEGSAQAATEAAAIGAASQAAAAAVQAPAITTEGGAKVNIKTSISVAT